jgi:hypothetical protein
MKLGNDSLDIIPESLAEKKYIYEKCCVFDYIKLKSFYTANERVNSIK